MTLRLPEAFEQQQQPAKAPFKDRVPDGLWKVLEYAVLLGIVLTLVLGRVI